jgi:hypothetical protein
MPLKISVRFSQEKVTPSQQLEQSWLPFFMPSIVLERVSQNWLGTRSQ